MEWVSLLALVFALSTAVLAVILIRQLRVGKRMASRAPAPEHRRLPDILQTNLSRSDIRDVARAASSLLVESFGCERILFLRYHRGSLRINYRHNLDSAGPPAFHFRPGDELTAQLLARPILSTRSRYSALLPSDLNRAADNLGLDHLLPVGWGENLYGLYFLGFTHQPSASQCNLIAALVAQPLAAAYHMRWHEYKLDSAFRKLEQQQVRSSASEETATRRRRMILTLLRRPEPHRVIPELFETLCTELNFSRAVLVEADRDCNSPCRVHQWQIVGSPEVPPPELIIVASDNPELARSRQLSRPGGPVDGDLVTAFRRCHLERLVHFPLSTDRAAVLAWSGDVDPAEVDRTLAELEAETRMVVKTADSFNRLQQLSCTDPLTELPNRRYFIRRLAEEVKRARRFGRSLTLVFLDVDFLKQVNDRYGHLAGDAVLHHLGQVVSATIRTIDVLCRYGGDEFCIIMPETDRDRCIHFLARLGSTVANYEFTTPQAPSALRCTVSMGAAIFPDHAADPRQLLEAADRALLRAKETGRNNYQVYSTTA